MDTMDSQSPTPPQSATSGTTQAGETSHDVHDVAVKPDLSTPVDDTFQEQSALRISLLLISNLLSMFLVALDRTIITTV